jgi:hypothetical protein
LAFSAKKKQKMHKLCCNYCPVGKMPSLKRKLRIQIWPVTRI